MVKKWRPTLEGRCVGVLVGDGFPLRVLDDLSARVEVEGGKVFIIGAKKGSVNDGDGVQKSVHHALAAAPSVLFDAIAVLASSEGAKAVSGSADTLDFLRDAHRHLKTIGHNGEAVSLLRVAGLASDESIIDVDNDGARGLFVARAKAGKYWARERH